MCRTIFIYLHQHLLQKRETEYRVYIVSINCIPFIDMIKKGEHVTTYCCIQCTCNSFLVLVLPVCIHDSHAKSDCYSKYSNIKAWPSTAMVEISYYNSSNVCLCVCVCVCVFPISSEVLVGVYRWTSHLPLRGSFSKRSTGRPVNGSLSLSTILHMRQPHATRCNGAFSFAAGKQQSLILRLLLHCISTLYVGAPRNCPWGVVFLKGQWVDGSTGRRVNGSNGSHLNGVCRWTSQLPSWVFFRQGQQVDGSKGQTGRRVDGSLSLSLYYIW